MTSNSIRALLRGAVCAAAGFASALMLPASAQDAAEFNIASATVMIIRSSLANRHQQLAAHFQSGVIGLTYDGQVALRDAASLDKPSRTVLEALIAEDNKDRATLYREMARSNGRPDWEASWRTTFAERWIVRAPPGWYYREYGGRWVKKLPSTTAGKQE